MFWKRHFLAWIPSVLFISVQLLISGKSFSQTGPYLGQEPPGMEPRIFVPESLRSNADWYWHGAPAFTPDSQEFYLDIYVPENNTGIQIRFMEMIDEVWTSPGSPDFAGSTMDASPSFMDGGNTVFFISDRPGGYHYRVWSSTRIEDGWAEPTPVNIPSRPSLSGGWRVSVTRDETLYMRMRDSISNTDMDIYRVRKVNGSYSEPERLDDNVNSLYMDLGTFIDPDESYIIFGSNRPGGYGNGDLYISFKRSDDSWTPAVNMGSPVNSSASEGSPYVSPDGLYLFFLSDREPQYGRNPYWVDAQVIEELRPNEICCECADCDGNGAVNILDALWEVNCILGVVSPPCTCDCHQDGADNVLDVLCIVNIILGIIPECPGDGYRPEVTPEVVAFCQSLKSHLPREDFSLFMALVKAEIRTPSEYYLSQNCPNPFNPTTHIHYTLPVTGERGLVIGPVHTTLKIYNMLGQEVRTLVDDVKEPGYYRVTWDGRDNFGEEVSSGVYFYRLTAGEYSVTKRMVLMK